MTNNASYKIDLLLEGIEKLMPAVGAIGLGYLGLHGAGDLAQGNTDQVHSELGLGAYTGGHPLTPKSEIISNLFNPDSKTSYEVGRHIGHFGLSQVHGPDGQPLTTNQKFMTSFDKDNASYLKLGSQLVGGLSGAAIGHSIGKSIRDDSKK